MGTVARLAALRQRILQSTPEPLYTSYAEAIRATPGDYENADLVDLICRRALTFFTGETNAAEHPLHYASLAAIARTATANPGQTISVIDVGGGNGVTYLQAKAVLPDLALRWAVVDTQAMVSRCRSTETADLRFFDALHEATEWTGPTDLVHASGVVQYVPDPMIMVRDILGVGAPFVLFSRLPLWREQVTLVQRSRLVDHGIGPLPEGVEDRTVSYPATIMADSAFRAAIAPHYRVAWELHDPSAGYTIKGKDRATGHAFLLRRTDT